MSWLSRVISCGTFVYAVALSTPMLADDLPDEMQMISVKLSKGAPELEKLRQAGFRVLGVDYEKGLVQIAIESNETESFEALSMPVVQVETLNTRIAPDERYYTYDGVVAQLNVWEREHRDILKKVKVGRSVEGRDIFAVKISDHVDVTESGESAILFNGMHHAREVMTVEVTMDIIQTLIEQYDTDSRVKKWVDEHEIWVLPMVNPDGNHRVWTQYNMWRKNTRDDKGVDINRNYPYAWGTCNGSSDNPSLDTYRGTGPGSEPETQAVMNLVASIKPVFNISYHTFSELVLYPYGCRGQRVDNTEVVEGIGSELAAKLVRDSGNGTYTPGTPWELLYAVDGSDVDWMYHEYGVIPYVIEVNAVAQGFQPDYKWRDPTVEKMRAGWQFLLNKLSTQGVRGRIPAESTGSIFSQSVRMKSLGRSQAESIWPLRADGTFQAYVETGMYRLEWKENQTLYTKDVIVGETFSPITLL